MGKSISKGEYQAARDRLSSCKSQGCRNAPLGAEDDPYCQGCKASNRIKKTYERNLNFASTATIGK